MNYIRKIIPLLFILFNSLSDARTISDHPKFPQEEINHALLKAHDGSRLNGLPLTAFSSSGCSSRSAFSAVKSFKELKSPDYKWLATHNSLQQPDTVLVGEVPNDTMVITGNFTHTGPIFVFNEGVLIFHNANVTNVGDVYVFGHGRLLADSSSLFFPQQYFYERSLVAVQNGYIQMAACSLSYGGFSHNLVMADSAIVEMNSVYFNDWTTAGLSGHSALTMDGSNLGGEYIMTDRVTATFKHVNTLILWHHVPETAVINTTFPSGSSVINYVFNNSLSGISGINYQLTADSCTNVQWALMPVNGSDVTVSNSTIRAIGAWFQHGDTVSVSGLVDNSNYSNFIAPLPDRNLHLVNSSVQTWSLYAFDSSKVNITSSIVGEVGCQARSQVISSQFFLDGSGGYFWATDTSFIVASSVSVTSSVRSERNGIFLLGYSSLTGGNASAIGNSVMIVVQSSLPQDPVAYDKAVAWYANIAQPSTTNVNDFVHVSGSAWIDQGPLGSFMDFGSYSLYYQPQGGIGWNPLVVDSATEIRNADFAIWNTTGLSSGNYLLRLVLKDDLGDSVEAIKSVTLLPSILNVEENGNSHFSLTIFPNPVVGNLNIEVELNKASCVNIQVINVLGELVKTIVIQDLNAGIHYFGYDASKQENGIYFIKIFTESGIVSRRFVVQHE